MRDVQPPITNDQELAGYRSGRASLDGIIAEREAALFASRDDPQRIEDARQELYRVYRTRQGIIDVQSPRMNASMACNKELDQLAALPVIPWAMLDMVPFAWDCAR
jgi:hypothetical protein